MSIISMVLVVVVAFLAGLEGILDQFQFHQPLVACTLIGLVTGNLTAGTWLGKHWCRSCTRCSSCISRCCDYLGSWW